MTNVNYTYFLTPGTPENVSQVQQNFTDLRAVVNGQLDTNNLAAGAAIVDTQLASPNNAVWRPVFAIGGAFLLGGSAAGTYVLRSVTQAEIASTTNAVHAYPLWHPVSADVAVTGKTTQIRLVADLTCNATAPGITFTIGLYPITAIAGGSGLTTVTLGSVAATVAFATPAASSAHRAEGSAVTLPAAASYMFAVVTSGTMAANTTVGIHAEVQMRHA